MQKQAGNSAELRGQVPPAGIHREQTLHPRSPALRPQNPTVDAKQWELWYIPCYGCCRISIITRINTYRTLKEAVKEPYFNRLFAKSLQLELS